MNAGDSHFKGSLHKLKQVDHFNFFFKGLYNKWLPELVCIISVVRWVYSVPVSRITLPPGLSNDLLVKANALSPLCLTYFSRGFNDFVFIYLILLFFFSPQNKPLQCIDENVQMQNANQTYFGILTRNEIKILNIKVQGPVMSHDFISTRLFYLLIFCWLKGNKPGISKPEVLNAYLEW